MVGARAAICEPVTGSNLLSMRTAAKVAVGLGIVLILVGIIAATYNGLTHEKGAATGAISLILGVGFGCPGLLVAGVGMFLLNRRNPS